MGINSNCTDLIIEPAPADIWYGGFDCSGEPNLTGPKAHEPYIATVIIARFPEGNPLQLGADFERLRLQYVVKTKEEFHAHQLSEEIHCAMLETAKAYNLIVGAVIIDKVRTAAEWEVGRPLPKPNEIREGAIATILEAFFHRYRLKKLWVDEDVRGQAARKEKTAIQQLHNSIWPNAKLQCQHKASHHSELIQVADVAAYSLRMNVLKSIRTEPLRRITKTFWSDPRHILLGPGFWTPNGFMPSPKQE